MKSDIYYRIRKKYMQLRPSERRVADVLLNQPHTPQDTAAMTIEWLAQAAGVSQPTVIRFAKALGLDGFRELKTALLLENTASGGSVGAGEALSFHVSPDDKMVDVPAKVISTNIRQLEDTLKNISTYELIRAVNAIAQARRVFLIAAENSCAVAEDLTTKLVYLGIPAVFYTDPFRQNVGARTLGEPDVAVAISYTGVSKSSMDALEIAKATGAQTIAVTNFEKAPLNRYADIILCAGNQQYLYGGAVFSRCSQLAIVDMLYTGLLLTDYPRFTSRLEDSGAIAQTFNWDGEAR